MSKNRLAKTKTILLRSLIYIELGIVAIIVLYPILWIVSTSVDSVNNLARTSLIPQGFTFDNFIRLMRETDFLAWYRNSAYIAVLTTFFSVLINTLTAFIFARFKFKGKKAALLSVMILQIFPSFMGMTAIFMIALNFGMLDNLNMLIIIYVANSIPFNVWLIKGHLQNLPRSIDEAAYIDGATKLQVFAKILLPLSGPMISFIALTSFITPWMDYMLPRFLIRSSENQTVAIGLFLMSDTRSPNYDITAFCAGAIMIALPFAILYMVCQKFLITGLAAGANKGE